MKCSLTISEWMMIICLMILCGIAAFVEKVQYMSYLFRLNRKSKRCCKKAKAVQS